MIEEARTSRFTLRRLWEERAQCYSIEQEEAGADAKSTACIKATYYYQLITMRFGMNHRHDLLLLLLTSLALCMVLSFELSPPQGNAAPNPSPALSPNVTVVNTPGVHVLNTPTVRVQERNWKYQAVIVPKAFPGTSEWNEFVERLNGYGQQGWELVNIVESVALMKKPT